MALARPGRSEHPPRANRLHALAWTLALMATVLSAGLAQAAPTGTEILQKALDLQKGIKDYVAKVSVKSNIPDMDIPDREATVYVKPPDNVYIESRGIVFIPKRALLFGSIGQEIEKETKAVLIGTKTTGGAKTYCVKLVPKEPASDGPGREGRLLVWVDGSRWTAERVHVMVGDKVMVAVDFTYEKVQGFWVPTKVTASAKGEITSGDEPARISIFFRDYKINTGLTDEFFKEKQSKSRGSDRPRRRHGRPGTR